MEIMFLALVLGAGELLTLDQLKARARDHRRNGLVLVYHQALKDGQLLPITASEWDSLPLHDRDHLLATCTDNDHEEQNKDEIFVGNYNPKEKTLAFCKTTWDPRYGKRAYSITGRLMPDHSPAFAKVRDIWPMVKWP